MKTHIKTTAILACVLGLAVSAHAQDATAPAAPTAASTGSDKDLLNLDLNDLMNIKVTTASKTAESFNKVAASLYVVTADDIRRSGAQNIPEALRLVPGVEVAQLNGGQYAVSIRGFNSAFSDKLLVLVDGRSIYNNLYGGVFWEDQQMPMADIDRIEVIRGPGTAIWGANAVQGIINIITKTAQDTQGVQATAEYGDGITKNQETLRYGDKFGTNGAFRIYGMTSDFSDGLNPNGSFSPDAYIDTNGGFRLDNGTDQTGKLQVSGDAYQNVNNTTGTSEVATPPYYNEYPTTATDSGGDLLAHYEKLQSNGSTLSLQADYTDNNQYLVPLIRDAVNAENIDFQDSLAPSGPNSLIFGFGYRNEASRVNGLTLLGTAPFNSTEDSISGYFQDQLALSKTLTAQIGSKFEHDSFTGWEYEPSAHLGYTPDDQHTVWVSASRAVRIPALTDNGYPAGINAGGEEYPGTETLITEIFKGTPGSDSEIVAAYEAGYRVQATSKLLIDLSTFYNQYSQLLGVPSFGSVAPYAGPPAGLQEPIVISEIGSGHSVGGELATHVKVADNWRVNFGYSYLYAKVPVSLFQSQIDSPNSQTEIQSYYDISKALEFDSAVYFVGANPEVETGSYTKLDIGLAYHPTNRLEVRVGGNNLLKNEYSQYTSSSPVTSYLVQREFYTKVTWKL